MRPHTGDREGENRLWGGGVVERRGERGEGESEGGRRKGREKGE